jgi:hypothetical protein
MTQPPDPGSVSVAASPATAPNSVEPNTYGQLLEQQLKRNGHVASGQCAAC